MKALVLLVLAGCAFEAPVEQEGLPEVSFEIDQSLVDESIGTTPLQLKLSRKSEESVTVRYEARGGGGSLAEASKDFAFAVPNREATFSPGVTRVAIPVKIVNDGVEEEEENVEIELTLVQHAVLGATARHKLRISRDFLPRARFSLASSEAPEGGPPQRFRVELSAPSMTDVVLQQTLSAGTTGPGDHSVVSAPLTIPRGQLSIDIPAGITNDPTDEIDETFDVSLSGLEGVVVADGNNHAHKILDDDDEPQIGFAVAASSVSEAGTQAQLAVTLSLASEKDITVDYGVIGGTAGLADFTLDFGTLSFPAGTTTQMIAVAINNADVLDELDETALVELSNAVHARLGRTQHTLTILDNDNPPTISFMQAASTVAEGAGTASVTVVLSAASGRDVQFSLTPGGTAMSGDRTLPALPLTIPAGERTRTFDVVIIDDNDEELDETVTLVLSNVLQATPSGTTTHTLTITDNDDLP